MIELKARDFRCSSCGRLQFRAVMLPGCIILTRCPKCGMFMRVDYKTEEGVVIALSAIAFRIDEPVAIAASTSC